MFHIVKYHFVNLPSQHIVVKLFHNSIPCIHISLVLYPSKQKLHALHSHTTLNLAINTCWTSTHVIANLSFHTYQTNFLLFFSKYLKDIVICEHQYFFHHLRKLLLTKKDVSLDHRHHDTMAIEFSKHFELVPPSLKVLLQL